VRILYRRRDPSIIHTPTPTVPFYIKILKVQPWVYQSLQSVLLPLSIQRHIALLLYTQLLNASKVLPHLPSINLVLSTQHNAHPPPFQLLFSQHVLHPKKCLNSARETSASLETKDHNSHLLTVRGGRSTKLYATLDRCRRKGIGWTKSPMRYKWIAPGPVQLP
jgi:hypothetical protein